MTYNDIILAIAEALMNGNEAALAHVERKVGPLLFDDLTRDALEQLILAAYEAIDKQA